MKKIFFLIVVLSYSIVSNSQEAKTDEKQKVYFGVKAGFNAVIPTKDKYHDEESTTYGYQIGGTVTIPISKRFLFQPELLVQSIGYHYKYISEYSNGTISNETKFKRTLLEIPLNFKYAISKKMDLDFGPFLGFSLNSKRTTTNISNLDGVTTTTIFNGYIDGYKDPNELLYGVNLGVNYNFTEKIYSGFRYSLFINKYQSFDNTLDNSVFAFSVGYNFR